MKKVQPYIFFKYNNKTRACLFNSIFHKEETL